MRNNDLNTRAYILRRTNYEEADRILNMITPMGKLTAIAKGVRKEKSKLAGGVEMFSLVDLVLHGKKSDFYIVTSSKMIKYYSNILKNYDRLQLASLILKKVGVVADSVDCSGLFDIVDQCFCELDSGTELLVVETWFLINLAIKSGEEVNVYRDVNGEKLEEGAVYAWNNTEMALQKRTNGNIATNEIKVLRLMLNNKLATIKKIKNIGELISPILEIARSYN